jgi:hypothetical protein
MPLETATKAATDVVNQTMKVTETAIKKAWSIMEAATEKHSPSEYLSKKAVNSMQGKLVG